MGDIPYLSPEKVTIKVKDEECTEKVLKDIKAIKNSTDAIKESNAYIIGSIRLKHESVMNALKLIFVLLMISININIILLLVLCYSLRIFG